MADIRIIPAQGAINVTGSADFRGDSASTVLYVSGSGNVGVGTSNPISKLHVAGAIKGTATTGHVLGTSTDTSRALSILNSGLAHGESYSLALGYANSNNNQAEITYFLSATGSTSNRLSLGLYNSADTLNVVGTGRVGVGITNPSTALEVIGVIRNKNSSGNANYGQFSTTEAQTTISTYSVNTGAYPADIIFSPATTERVRITTDGNVGIGITTPANRLSIGSTQDGGIDFLYDGFNNYKNQIKNYWNSGTDTRMDFNIGRTSGVAPVTIMSVGYGSNVGIGLTNPSYRLTVMNSAGATVNIGGGNSNSIPAIAIQSTSGSWASSENGFAYYYNASDGDLDLYRKNNSTTEAHVMTWQRADGNVGIGLTSPSYKLHTIGQVAVQGDEADLWLISTGGGAGVWRILGSAGNTTKRFRVYDNDNGVDRFNINATGSIKFNAYGSGTFTGTAAYSLAVDSSGNIIETTNSSLSGTGTTNRVAYWTGASTLAADADFSFDGTNVGIGVTNPYGPLEIYKSNSGGLGGFLNLNNNGSAVANETAVLFNDGGAGASSGVRAAISSTVEDNPYYGDIKFKTGLGTYSSLNTRMIILGNGNVGIGTTSPAQKLEVNGNIKLSSTVGSTSTPSYIWLGNDFSNGATKDKLKVYLYNAAGGEQYGFSVGSSGDVQYHSNVYHDFYVDNSRKFRISSAGAEVTGDLTVTGKITAREFHTTFVSASIIYQSGSTQFGNSSDDTHIFTGNVGIGTTSPAAISGYSAQTLNGTDGSFTEYRQNGTALFRIGADISRPFLYGMTNAPMDFYTNTNLWMRITAAGNIGIGTTAPAAKLDVVASNSTLAISYGNTVPNNPLHTNYYGGYTGIGMDSATAGVRIVGDTNTLVMDAGYYSSGTVQHANWNSLLRVLTNGNVGINTTAPTNKLQVVGGVTATSFTGSLLGNVDGNITGTAASETLTTVTTRNNTTSNTIVVENASNTYVNTVSAQNRNLTVYQGTSGADAYMTFHISGDYAGYFGLGGAENDLVWGGWSVGNNRYRIWHSGNDGAGSGLDADTLDGNHASAFLTAEADTLSSVTGRGASTSTETSFNATVNAYRLILPQNTVGTTYAGVVTQPTYYIGQSNGNDDAWKIYGESGGGTNTGTLVLQSEDDYDGNESIVLRFKRTYSGYNTTDALVAKFDRVYTNVNLGVGTTAPSNTLQVVGGVTATSFTGSLQGSITGTAASETLSTVTGRGSVTTTPMRVEVSATGLGGYMSVGNSAEIAGNYSAYFFGNTPGDASYFKGGIAYETIASTYGRGNIHFLQNSTTSGDIVTLSDSVMTILNGGNVGIATTSPSNKLQVVGGVTATSFTGSLLGNVDGNVTGTAGGETLATVTARGASTSTDVAFGANSGGDLGIQIRYGDGAGHYGRIRFYQNGSNHSTIHSFSAAWQSGTVFTSAGAINLTGQNGVTFGSWDTPDAVIVTGGQSYFKGSVGIGTTSPSEKLHVLGGKVKLQSAANGYGWIYAEDVNHSIIIRGDRAGTVGNYTNYYQYGSDYAAGGGHFFYTGGALASQAVRFSISNDYSIFHTGNVGIGVTAPTGKLHVTSGGGDGSPILRITGTASDSFNWASSTMYANLTAGEVALHQIGKAESQYNAGHYGYRHVSDGSSANMLTMGMFQADYLVNILGTGNVGIGTSQPAEKLAVAGNIRSAGNVIASVGLGYGNYISMRHDDNNGYITITRTVYDGHLILEPYANVGIGTTVPSAKLQVKATGASTVAQFMGDQAFDGATRMYLTNDAYIYGRTNLVLTGRLDASNDGFSFGTNNRVGITFNTNLGGAQGDTGTEKYSVQLEGNSGTLYFQSSGSNAASRTGIAFTQDSNIGVGTTSPAAKLDVFGLTNTSIFNVRQSAGLLTQIESDNGYANLYLYQAGGNPKIGLVSNGSSYFNGGNVGIGTASPESRLHIAQSNSGGKVILYIDNNASSALNNEATLKFSVDGGASVSNGGAEISTINVNAGNGNSDLTFKTYNASAGFTEKVRITNDGNVGIGTTSPGNLLQVSYQNQTTDSLIRLGVAYAGDRSSRGGITWHDSADVTGKIFTEYDGTMTSMVFGSLYSSGYTSNRSMIIRGNGNVGIGTTSPGARLDVSDGSSYFRIWGNSAGDFQAPALAPHIASGDFTIYAGAVGSGTFRMVVKNGGNVGIGTTGPTALLHVYGDADLWHTRIGGGTGELRIGGQNGSGAVIQAYTPGGSVRDLYIQRDGANVGIATTSPGEKLDVVGNIALSGIFKGTGTGENKNFASYDWHWLGRRYANYVSDVRLKLYEYFYTTTAAVQEAFVNCYDMNSANYMGENIWGDVHSYHAIFTTHIYVKRQFTVSSVLLNGDDPYALWVDGEYVAGADGCCTGTTYSYTFTQGWHRLDLIYSEGGGGHFVQLGWNPKDYTDYIAAMTPFGPVNFYDTGNVTMRNGRVGIGTTNPSYKLHVVDGDDSIAYFGPNSTWSSYLAVGSGGSKVGSEVAQVISTDGNLHLDSANNSNAIYIQYYYAAGNTYINAAGGSVGVGTVSPSYKLDVTGTIRATGDVIAYSDARVKENVVTLENSLELVQKLRGVEYNKIGETDKKIGVIAQEVLEVVPQVVQQDNDGNYSVAYGNMAGLFIEAIKQQQTYIQALEARIQKLEEQAQQKL